jgi:lipoprotein-anchoring transpeptidase ErfK/SrfK
MRDSSPRTGGSRLRPALAALVALTALVPIIIALLLTSGARAPIAAATTSSFTPVAATPATPHAKAAPFVPGQGALVALIRHRTTLRSAPAGRALAEVTTRTGFGSPEAVWVVRRSGAWLGVVSTLAGNGRLGWIPQSASTLSRVPWELRVSLAARRLTVLDDGKVLERYTIAIGRPTAPTPTGRFAVTDRLSTGDPAGPYGCCIIALSALAPHAIQGWDGGNRIAIHSTPETSSIGEPVSHGCMRLTLAEGKWLLEHIPLGTPTLISA